MLIILRIYLRGVERWLRDGTPDARAHVAQQTRFLCKLLEDLDHA